MHRRRLLRNGGCERGYPSGVLTRESDWKGPGAEWPVAMTPQGLRTQEPLVVLEAATGKGKSLMRKERVAGVGCRSWTAEGTEWNW